MDFVSAPIPETLNVSSYDCDDSSIPVFENMGNFGTAIENDTGMPQKQEFIIDSTLLNVGSIDITSTHNFILTDLTVIFKSNEEDFGANKVLKVTFQKDGVIVFNKQYKNIIELASLADEFNVGTNATKIGATQYNLYNLRISFEGRMCGLVMKNDDYFKFEILDITDAQNPVLTYLDVPLATGGLHGFIVDVKK